MDRFRLLRRWTLRTVSSGVYRHLSPVMIEERNNGALARLPLDADAVLLWGSDHLPGLAAGLKRAGYRRRSTSWVAVGELPATWPCIRAFLTWLRASGKNDSTPTPEDADPPAPSPAN